MCFPFFIVLTIPNVIYWPNYIYLVTVDIGACFKVRVSLTLLTPTHTKDVGGKWILRQS